MADYKTGADTEEKALCTVCPLQCSLLPGESGQCGCRQNSGGIVMPSQYGRFDSIKYGSGADFGFSHFHTAGQFAAVSLTGKASFGIADDTVDYAKTDLSVESAESGGGSMQPAELCNYIGMQNGLKFDGVLFTGSEPFLSSEYIIDTAHLLHRENRVAAAITGGLVNDRIARGLASSLDACIVRLSATAPDTAVLQSRNAALIRQTVSLFYEKNVHIEIELHVTGPVLQTPDAVTSIFLWLSYIDRDIPVHLDCHDGCAVTQLEHIQQAARRVLSAVTLVKA